MGISNVGPLVVPNDDSTYILNWLSLPLFFLYFIGGINFLVSQYFSCCGAMPSVYVVQVWGPAQRICGAGVEPCPPYMWCRCGVLPCVYVVQVWGPVLLICGAGVGPCAAHMCGTLPNVWYPAEWKKQSPYVFKYTALMNRTGIIAVDFISLPANIWCKHIQSC